RNNAAQRIEKLFVLGELSSPLLVIDAEKFRDAFVIDIKFGKIEIVRAGHPANGRFDRAASLLATIDDPFEHAHILAEAGPEKISAHAFTEPVHIKNERRIR